jgi:glycerophosphoryl diester phosphodiesterase
MNPEIISKNTTKDLMLFDLIPPYFFAHRGACAHAPENTLEAFQLALEQGAKLIEFDVKLSADRNVVIIHDQTVDRTTDGKGKVNQLNWMELKQLDAGSWFDDNFRGVKIPALDEVFEILGKKLFMNVELTNYATPFDGLVDMVALQVKKHGLEKRVIFSSFFPTNLIRASQLLPEVPRGQLVLPGKAGGWQRLWGRLIDVQAIHPYTSDVTADSVEHAHRHRRLVHVWTVNTPREMKRLCDLGVDGFFTDDPQVAREVLDRP